MLDLEAALADRRAPGAADASDAGEDDDAAAPTAAAPAASAANADGPNVAVDQRLRNGRRRRPASRPPITSSRGRFRTSWVHQAYLEPQSTLAWVEPDGTLVVHSSTQGAFMVRAGLAKALGLPLDQIRVQAAPIGGAFGGKLMISEPLAAAAALKLQRPVRIVFSRTRGLRGRQPGARAS